MDSRVIATFDADEAIEALESGFAMSSLSLVDIDMPGSMDGAPVGGRHQRQVAADPLDSRDRVRAAKQERIAP